MRLIDADALKAYFGIKELDPDVPCKGCQYKHPYICSGGTYKLGDLCVVIDKMPTIKSEMQWIPVADRLPEHMEIVLVTSRHDGRFVARFFNDWYHGAYFAFYGDSDDVVAWMPLPAPYKEVNE